jgi:hypothetical protein
MRCIALFVECCIMFLLPFVYMSLHTAGRRQFLAEAASAR